MDIRLIRWGEPPERIHGDRPKPVDDWGAEVAATLRAAPGRWALIWEGSEQSEAGLVALRIGGRLGPFRDFQTAKRTVGRGVCRVYARYVGDGDGA